MPKTKIRVLPIFLIVLFILFFLTYVNAAQSISGLKVNTPVPLDTKLVGSGVYTNTDSNSQVYCKGVTIDPDKNNAQFDRFTDQLTFSDGSFYFEKKITEPLYFRASTYTFRVTCGTATQDINFAVGQRLNFFNQFIGETFFIRDNGFQLIVMTFGLLVLVILVGAAWAVYKKYLVI